MRGFVVFLVALIVAAQVAIKGFTYEATLSSGASKQEADFVAEFSAAQNLAGAPGFASARLYTMIQGRTEKDPISAIPAAIKTNTSLLLGLWASGGDVVFARELTALMAAIDQYGDDFTNLVVGISVGSNDLYSASGLAELDQGGWVTDVDTLINYIGAVRDTLDGTKLATIPIGHVEASAIWLNDTNQDLIEAVDWLGLSDTPYREITINNIMVAPKLFNDAVTLAKTVANGRPIWVAETGWSVSGRTSADALTGAGNAAEYWQQVGCVKLFGMVNTWWYTLRDAPKPDDHDPSFGIVHEDLNANHPVFGLSCDGVQSKPPADVTSYPTPWPPTPTRRPSTRTSSFRHNPVPMSDSDQLTASVPTRTTTTAAVWPSPTEVPGSLSAVEIPTSTYTYSPTNTSTPKHTSARRTVTIWPSGTSTSSSQFPSGVFSDCSSGRSTGPGLLFTLAGVMLAF